MPQICANASQHSLRTITKNVNFVRQRSANVRNVIRMDPTVNLVRIAST